MTRPWARRGELFAVLLIIIGILFMIQPFVLDLLAYGFVVTLVGLIGFTVVSHL